jgi:oligopeptide/dipeptide ABC transporter ATP-binding protein
LRSGKKDLAVSAPLLDIRDLQTWFPIRRGVFARTVGHVRAVDGVSLQMAPGETLGLVGESGCGKTTLARTVLGLVPATGGAVRFEGANLLSLDATAMRAVRPRLQVVFQDPYSSLNPRMTVMDIVTEGLVTHGMIPRAQREEHAERMLKDVGLGADALHRYPHEFSGGQRQRVSVARAISMKPRLVICDEPISALDVSVQAQVINLLMDLREEHRLAYLFISHDLSVVRRLCNRTAVMYLGQVVELGPTCDVIDRPAHPYTRALISAVPRVGGDPRKRVVLQGDVPSPAAPPPGCRFHPRCPYATEACRAAQPPLEALPGEPSRQVACCRSSIVGDLLPESCH